MTATRAFRKGVDAKSDFTDLANFLEETQNHIAIINEALGYSLFQLDTLSEEIPVSHLCIRMQADYGDKSFDPQEVNLIEKFEIKSRSDAIYYRHLGEDPCHEQTIEESELEDLIFQVMTEEDRSKLAFYIVSTIDRIGAPSVPAISLVTDNMFHRSNE